MSDTPPIRFAALGLDHIHVYGMTACLLKAGAEFAAFHGADEQAEGFGKLFPMARRAREVDEILDDETIPLVICAVVPDRRASLGAACMRRGKDVLMDKPGAVTLDELATLRSVQRETGRLYAIYFSERLENAATVRACELVREGAIGRPIHTLGLGPHKLGLAPRPAWFYDRPRYGGILADLACHQVDQFLYLTGATGAEVVSAQVANWNHPEHPGLEDFGELLLRSDGATGYARVDWFTPEGLGTWGDVRLVVAGTEGTLEVRKNCDLEGREGGNHLFLVDGRGVRHLDCAQAPLPFGPALLRDVTERTQTALPQEHTFTAMALALEAQARATRLGHLVGVR